MTALACVVAQRRFQTARHRQDTRSIMPIITGAVPEPKLRIGNRTRIQNEPM